jgi:hypothetical protein
MRDAVASAMQKSERSESPAEMRARHRRFKKNREMRQKRQAGGPPPEDDGQTTPGPTTPGESSEGEDSDDNKSSTIANAPSATPNAQIISPSIAAPAQSVRLGIKEWQGLG